MSIRLRHLPPSLAVAFLILFCFHPHVGAQNAELAWDQDSSQVAGYRVHYGQSTHNYTATADAGNNTTYTLNNLSGNTYFIAVTAYDSNNNESTYSPELTIYSMSSSAGTGGSITPSGNFFFGLGENQTFVITPATGYTVSGVQVDGNSVGAVTSYTFSNIAANHTISATFKSLSPKNFTISPTAGADGTISPSAAVNVSYGASQTFTITPATGCTVSGVQVDGNPVGAVTSYTFSNVAANHTISATFSQNPYTITANSGTNGTISPSGPVSVSPGANQTYTISPASRYQISQVMVDGKSIGAASSYTFTKVSANHTISATFASTGRLHIQATAQGGGSISPVGTVNVAAGTNRSFTIKPVAGNTLTSLLVDGTPVSAVYTGKSATDVATYTFTNLENDHSISAVFSQIPAPVTDPGPDQAVKTGSTVTLNGSNSTDAEVGIATYKWAQVSGPRVLLSNPSGPVCTFEAPNVAGGALLGFKLTVTNKWGISGSDTCLVNVSANNDPPLANAGPGQTVSPFTIVTLNGTGSSDPDGRIASYQWVQISGPKVGISNANTSHASFVAPDTGGSGGASMVFQLQVTDHFGLRTRDQCTVNVVSLDPPPVSDAGPNQTATEASAVVLDGSGSLDPAGSAVTYRWKQIRGVPVTLSDPSAATPVFTAPEDTGTETADLLFMLTVTDGSTQLSSTSECAVRIASR